MGQSPAPDFAAALGAHGLGRLRRAAPTTLQVNVGKRCNQACQHCHVDAGPNRTEVMTDSVAERIVTLLEGHPSIEMLDVTGGAPELAPCFRMLVSRARRLGRRVIDRCNLTVLLEPGHEDLTTTAVVIAHPVASVLALLLLRARTAGKIGTMAATVFEPVSEQGKRGMDELHQQTVNLLSFTALPKEVFDEQVAFNMLGRFGESSSISLKNIENRIASHFEAIAGKSLPVPSLMLVQAPTFHAHTFSIYIQFEGEIDASALGKALSGDHVTILDPAEDGPSNVSAAGQGNVLVSVRPDARNAGGFWIWAAADNLKIAAMSAVECAATLSTMRPLGKVQ